VDILYLLIPLSSVLVLGIVGVFAWALARGQFDDLEREGTRILDESQGPPAGGTEESPVDSGTASRGGHRWQ
jgi:cbb3-type cytochrome oxidase maturation protein